MPERANGLRERQGADLTVPASVSHAGGRGPRGADFTGKLNAIPAPVGIALLLRLLNPTMEVNTHIGWECPLNANLDKADALL